MPSGDSKYASTLEARLTAWKAENVLEPGSRLWGEVRKCLLVIQSVLQLLKHSRECIIRKGIDGKAIDKSGIDRRCIVKEGIDSSGIDGGADDVPENHRLHSIGLRISI